MKSFKVRRSPDGSLRKKSGPDMAREPAFSPLAQIVGFPARKGFAAQRGHAALFATIPLQPASLPAIVSAYMATSDRPLRIEFAATGAPCLLTMQ